MLSGWRVLIRNGTAGGVVFLFNPNLTCSRCLWCCLMRILLYVGHGPERGITVIHSLTPLKKTTFESSVHIECEIEC